MTVYRILFDGVIRGWQRAGKSKSGKFFMRDQTRKMEAAFATAAIAQTGAPCLAGPVALSASFYFVPPASWSAKRRAAALRGDVRPTGKPDFDNCAKGLCDALNGIAWKDDAQIVCASIEKFYADRPGADISFLELSLGS